MNDKTKFLLRTTVNQMIVQYGIDYVFGLGINKLIQAYINLEPFSSESSDVEDNKEEAFEILKKLICDHLLALNK